MQETGLKAQRLSPPPLSRASHNYRSQLLQMKANHMDIRHIKGGSTKRKQEQQEMKEAEKMKWVKM